MANFCRRCGCLARCNRSESILGALLGIRRSRTRRLLSHLVWLSQSRLESHTTLVFLQFFLHSQCGRRVIEALLPEVGLVRATPQCESHDGPHDIQLALERFCTDFSNDHIRGIASPPGISQPPLLAQSTACPSSSRAQQGPNRVPTVHQRHRKDGSCTGMVSLDHSRLKSLRESWPQINSFSELKRWFQPSLSCLPLLQLSSSLRYL